MEVHLEINYQLLKNPQKNKNMYFPFKGNKGLLVFAFWGVRKQIVVKGSFKLGITTTPRTGHSGKSPYLASTALLVNQPEFGCARTILGFRALRG